VKPLHRCPICEGRQPQPTKHAAQCPVVRIYENEERWVEKKLKRHKLWAGADDFEGLKMDHHRVARLISIAGDTLDPNWPARIGWYAETILSARVQVAAEEV
jgi:hypothetical protein